MEQRLLKTAATGPCFQDHMGKTHTHRRALSQTDEAAPASATDGDYGIDFLAEYMPPWEAFVHPKCGFYQDCYKVRWSSPHDKIDYSDNECGADILGATWEPDECLPDDVDALRLIAKRDWLAAERTKAAAALGEKTAAKAAAEKALEETRQGDAPPSKKRRVSLDAIVCGERFTDACDPNLFHGWQATAQLSAGDLTLIRSGWPKTEDEYPPGYTVVNPPGYCWEECDCMEDWHTGTKKHEAVPDEPRREYFATRAVENFLALRSDVRQRGQVSNQHYMEATREEKQAGDGTFQFIQALYSVIADAAQMVPLAALYEADAVSRSIFSRYAYVYTVCGPQQLNGYIFGYAPAQFTVKDGPAWLTVDPKSGDFYIDQALMPQPDEKRFQLNLELKGLDREMTNIGFTIFTDLEPSGFPRIAQLTQRVVRKLDQISQTAHPTLLAVVRRLLSPIFDFDTKSALPRPIAEWANVMADVAIAARACWRGHLGVHVAIGGARQPTAQVPAPMATDIRPILKV
jgi:hypothetical protein